LNTTLSARDARRIAINAQGLDAARPGAADRRHLGRLFERLGVVQID